MTLTPAILEFFADKPDEWVGRWVQIYLEARNRGVDAKEAHGMAVEAADGLSEGRSLAGKGSGRVSKERWLREGVRAVWDCYCDCYVDYWAAFHYGTEIGPGSAILIPEPLDLTEIRARMIQRCFGQWRDDKARDGRTPHTCVLDQVRGAFLVSETQKGWRPDPEYIFGKHTRGRGFAQAWWAQKTFDGKVEA